MVIIFLCTIYNLIFFLTLTLTLTPSPHPTPRNQTHTERLLLETPRKNRDRAKLLKYKKRNQPERILLVVTFDSRLPNIPKILKTNLESNKLSKLNLDLIGGTPITGYRIQDSLGKKLVRAKFKKQLLL